MLRIPVLRAKREELLSVHVQAEKFFTECISTLNLPAPVAAPWIMRIPASGRVPDLSPDEEPGTRIGHYRILQKIGEGGCGTVYMAEQEKPVRRRVALKVIKLGMDTKRSLPGSKPSARRWP